MPIKQYVYLSVLSLVLVLTGCNNRSNETNSSTTPLKQTPKPSNENNATLKVKISSGSGSYVEAVYINGKKIKLPELHDKEYMGHDSFKLDGNTLVRQYPIYKEGDPNCCPTGGVRTVTYEGLVK